MASTFLKLSQDPLAPVRAEVEKSLPPNTSLKTISLIGNEVKIAVHCETPATINRSQLQDILSSAVKKIDPSLTTSVSIDLSSEGTMASLNRTVSQFQKLAQAAPGTCAPGDPLCDDLGAGLPPDQPTKPSPKPPAPKPVVKKDVNKADDGATSNPAIRASIEAVLQQIPGTKLIEITSAGPQIDVKVEVPQQHSFTASQLGKTLTDQVNKIAPGHQVIALLSFSTEKAASKRF